MMKSGSSPISSTYPYDCQGIVKTVIIVEPVMCSANIHWSWSSGAGKCDASIKAHYTTNHMYECIEDDIPAGEYDIPEPVGGNPGDPSNPSGGSSGNQNGGASPIDFAYDDSITTPVRNLPFTPVDDDAQFITFYNGLSSEQQNIIDANMVQFFGYLVDNDFSEEAQEAAIEIINFYIEEGDIKQKIQQAIANGITTTAEYTHNLFNKLSIIANNYPSSINYINAMMNGVRSFISANSLVNTNPLTCTFNDLFNMWLFELGPNPININGMATTTVQLLNQECVTLARNKALLQIQNGNFAPIQQGWTYGQQQFYDGMANGNLVTAFLGSYTTNVTISSTPNGYQLNFHVTNPSSWESATRFRIDNDNNGTHDGVFPNTDRDNDNDISIGGNFIQNWYWSEPVN